MPTAASPGSSATSGPLSIDVEASRKSMYDDPKNWLCLPGTSDALCTTGLDATIVRADGTTEVERHVVDADPSFDCFYVYPTVSIDSGSNSDLIAGSEETNIVKGQAARYSRVCRVFVPIYRQVTLATVTLGTISDDAQTRAYLDVVAAFNHYLTHYNMGRGFVLVAHSQGSSVLKRLLSTEFDKRPELRARLIAAHLLGETIAVPAGKDVGGDFKTVPLCRSDAQSGCAIAYSTFRDRSPPPSNSEFGRAVSGRAACTSPAALMGGSGILTPYFENSQPAFSRAGAAINTPFVTFPDFLKAECVDKGDLTYLQLTVLSDSNDPRVDDIRGDLTPEWGLHLVDMHIALGTLVELARKQAAAFRSQH